MDLQPHIEQLTGFSLPQEYIDLLAEYPAALRDLPRAADDSPHEGFVSTVELMSDPADVASINQEVRFETVLDPEGNEFAWPDQVLVIGENGEGDYYGIDLCQEDARGVLLFDHQSAEFEEITGSLSEYVELLLESFPA